MSLMPLEASCCQQGADGALTFATIAFLVVLTSIHLSTRVMQFLLDCTSECYTVDILIHMFTSNLKVICILDGPKKRPISYLWP